MNFVRILLLFFLVYAAMKQKSEESRNVILIVTGLLAVCMMNKEGIINNDIKSGCPAGGVPVASLDQVDSDCTGGKVIKDDGTGCADNALTKIDPLCTAGAIIKAAGTGCRAVQNLEDDTCNGGTVEGVAKCCGSNATCTARPLYGDADNGVPGAGSNICSEGFMINSTCTCENDPSNKWTYNEADSNQNSCSAEPSS